MEKRERPVAECPLCGEAFWGEVRFNAPHSCLGRTGRRRGAIQSRLGVDDWAECGRCAATGRLEGEMCERCRGAGWICTRNT